MEVENDVQTSPMKRPAVSVHDLVKLDTNLDAWKANLRSTSDLFRRDPALESSSAFLNFRVLNRYFVNTEGTVTRNGKSSLYLYLYRQCAGG